MPDGTNTCNYGYEPNLCGKPAAWHVIWTPDGENSTACEEHAAEAQQRWTAYDRHPFGGVCIMPGTFVVWSWQEPPGLCKWHVEDEELAAAANATVEEAIHA